tara:strand:+ start:174 stop:563 length:390 start_codon:yes stop_codon:yes gene_type:complete
MANNPKIHTVTGIYSFAADTGGDTTATTVLANTGFVPKGAFIKSVTVFVADALAGGGSWTHFDVYLKGAAADTKIAEFAKAGVDADKDVQSSVPVTATGLTTEEVKIGFRPQGAAMTEGIATILIEYIN